MRPWIRSETMFVTSNINKLTHAQIGERLGRTRLSVKNYCQQKGIIGRRFWSESEKQYVREHYGKRSAREIGDAIHRTARQVYQQARLLGLCVPQNFRAPDMIEFIRTRHADGWTDSEIAKARKVDRHAISHVRRELGLPANTFSQHRRRCVAEKTREQLQKAGVPTLSALRVKTFRDRARAAGWPEDFRPRAVQILNALWERGPMTRPQIAEAIDMPWIGSRASLKSNDPEGSYLAHLIRRGFVIVLPRAHKVHGQGKGRSLNVYSLPLNIERRTPDEQQPTETPVGPADPQPDRDGAAVDQLAA